MLDRAASARHRIWVWTRPIQHVIDQMLVLPACDPRLGSRCATVPQDAGLAIVDPVTPELNTALFARVATGQLISRGANQTSRAAS